MFFSVSVTVIRERYFTLEIVGRTVLPSALTRQGLPLISRQAERLCLAEEGVEV